MIPDVPRSLRDQLKKENMMLMEFLLNQDQEAHAKSHGPKRPNPCFPTHIDIVVEAPEREQEEVEAEGIESIPGGLGRSGDSDPEFGRSSPEKEESTQEEPGGKGEDEAGGGGEETQLEDDEEDAEGLKKQQEGDEETEDKYQRREEDAEEVKTAENCSVDLDALMSEMGLLGEKGDLNARLQLFLLFIFTASLHPFVYILIYLHLFCTTYCNLALYIIGVHVATYLHTWSDLYFT